MKIVFAVVIAALVCFHLLELHFLQNAARGKLIII